MIRFQKIAVNMSIYERSGIDNTVHIDLEDSYLNFITSFTGLYCNGLDGDRVYGKVGSILWLVYIRQLIVTTVVVIDMHLLMITLIMNSV